MGSGWYSDISQRLVGRIYRDEAIPNAPVPTPKTPRPKLLLAMRALVTTTHDYWQSRAELFLKQARLMVNYEDDYVYKGVVNQYFPTYDSLSNAQLRGYFTWRTALRRGIVEKKGMSYASLYVYELLHLIGCRDAQDAYEKLHAFCESYRVLDPQIGRYIAEWEDEFVIYYGLDPKLMTWRGDALARQKQDEAIDVMLHRAEHTAAEVMAAVCVLSSYRLERSKLYRAHTDEVNAVTLRVLDRVTEYYEKHRQISAFADLIAVEQTVPVRLFSSAVFQPPKEEPDRVYEIHPLRRYECVSGYWALHSYERADRAPQRLGAILRGIDAALRARFDLAAIQPPKLKKWQEKIIQEEIEAFFREQKAAEARRVRLDFSKLARIRADADVTQERLVVEEEEELILPDSAAEPSVPPAPADEMRLVDQGADVSEVLDAVELRLLRALLAAESIVWVRSEGHMLSVLVDGINEKLYDDFEDTVIEGDPPAVVPDYRDELIERYLHGSE